MPENLVMDEIDITAQIPELCRYCLRQDLTIKQHTLYLNEVPQIYTFVCCRNKELCTDLSRYIKNHAKEVIK